MRIRLTEAQYAKAIVFKDTGEVQSILGSQFKVYSVEHPLISNADDVFVLINPSRRNEFHFPKGIPESMRGKGLGSAIVKSAIDFFGYISVNSRDMSPDFRAVVNKLVASGQPYIDIMGKFYLVSSIDMQMHLNDIYSTYDASYLKSLKPLIKTNISASDFFNESQVLKLRLTEAQYKKLREVNYQFHKGDIEDVGGVKPYGSDNIFRMRGRDTGHFGSGLYFATYSCENADNISREFGKYSSSADRDIDGRLKQVKSGVYRVDFDIYKNLYRVTSKKHGEFLFNTLKLVNNLFNYYVSYGTDSNFKRNYLILLNNMDKLNLNLPLYKGLLQMFDKGKGILRSYEAEGEDLASMSTKIMQYNGFNGVNVANIPFWDSLLHGSVIYDMSKIGGEPVEVENPSYFCEIKRGVITSIGDVKANVLAGDDISWGRFQDLSDGDKLMILKVYDKYINPYYFNEEYFGSNYEKFRKLYFKLLVAKIKQGVIEKLPDKDTVTFLMDTGVIGKLLGGDIFINGESLLTHVLNMAAYFDDDIQRNVLLSIPSSSQLTPYDVEHIEDIIEDVADDVFEKQMRNKFNI